MLPFLHPPIFASLTCIAPPEIPQLTDLKFVDVTDTSIDLRWTPINASTIIGYRITVVAAGESIPIYEEFVHPSEGHYKVSGLEPGIDYEISVITLINGGESAPTTIVQQTGDCTLLAYLQRQGSMCSPAGQVGDMGFLPSVM